MLLTKIYYSYKLTKIFLHSIYNKCIVYNNLYNTTYMYMISIWHEFKHFVLLVHVYTWRFTPKDRFTITCSICLPVCKHIWSACFDRWATITLEHSCYFSPFSFQVVGFFPGMPLGPRVIELCRVNSKPSRVRILHLTQGFSQILAHVYGFSTPEEFVKFKSWNRLDKHQGNHRVADPRGNRDCSCVSYL